MSRCACGRATRIPSGPCTYCKRKLPGWSAENERRRKLRMIRLAMFARPKTREAS